ncbi:MAG: V-type ATP synthase subunit E [Coprococcus sp.]
MTGLEKIVEQILEEANTCASDIIKTANADADKIIAEAEKTAGKIQVQSDEKLVLEKASGDARAKSSSDLKKRQAVLKAKQEIINDIIDKAYKKILNLDDDKYFALIEKCLDKSIQNGNGEIYFSDKDLKRLPKDMEARIAKTAEAKGGKLVIADKPKNIDGGFILVYGGIEENCSFKAMFNAERERLADKVNSFLFA